jgi:hypothetical protein
MQLTNGIESNNLTTQQFQNIPGGPNATPQARSLARHQAILAQQQASQMPGVMTQGQSGGAFGNYNNPDEIADQPLRRPAWGLPQSLSLVGSVISEDTK